MLFHLYAAAGKRERGGEGGGFGNFHTGGGKNGVCNAGVVIGAGMIGVVGR